MSFWNLFGGGVVKSLENIASEWIETDMESAEAKVVMIKALDPNGKMRRDLSRAVTQLYQYYIVVASLLVMAEAFSIGDPVMISTATSNWVNLFVPITALFGAIVTASFGVNAVNSAKAK